MCSPEGSSGPWSGHGDGVSCTSIYGREEVHGESQMCSPEGSSGPGSGCGDGVSCNSIHGERSSMENQRCAHLKVLLDQGLGVEIASLVLVSMEERTSMENRLSGNRLRCLN
jgi:hypothetical protein